MTQIEKNLQLGKKFNFFVSNTTILRIPRPPKRTSKLQEKPAALKREHPALKT
jgi:hypothetical protein